MKIFVPEKLNKLAELCPENLYIVGGAQNVVTWYFPNIGRICAASKRSKSYTNVAASHSHCPYSLPHAAFAQQNADSFAGNHIGFVGLFAGGGGWPRRDDFPFSALPDGHGTTVVECAIAQG